MRLAATGNVTKQQIYDFLTMNRAAALATVSPDGIPHVATVYCIIKPDLTIYFSTRAQGRKYNNLTENPLVAMNFTDLSGMRTVQLTGMAFRVEDLLEEQEILYELTVLRYQDAKLHMPSMKLFEQGAANEVAIIKIRPNELTFANFGKPDDGRYRPFFEKVI